MLLYDTLPGLNITHQPLGSVWMVLLRGSTEEIELAFNGLYNMGATNGSMEYLRADKTLAKFWSSEPQMRKYFKIRHELKFDAPKFAAQYADAKLSEMKAESEVFYNYNSHDATTVFHMGQSTAERPDTDFKDACFAHAFR